MSSTDFDGIVPGDHHDAWYVSKAVWGATVACFFAMAAILIATGQIYHHLRHYHEPVVQRYTIRILLMVPIYAFDSCVSLFTYKTIVAFIMTLLRDIYEAYTLYNFLALMLCYLGGANVLVSKWREDMHSPKEGGNSSDDPEDLSNVFSWWTMTCCLKSMLTIDINNPMFLRMIKAGVLQYIFVKIFLAIFALVMECLDLYHEGQFRIKGGFLYFVIIQNISIFISLYSLVVFYLATKKYLAPFKPVIKFAMIKLIIFVTFWQGAVIAFLFFLQVLEPIKGLTKGASSVFMQNFLICIEAVPLAGLNWLGFPPGTVKKGKETNVRHALKHFVRMRDVLQDTMHTFNPNYKEFVVIEASEGLEGNLDSTPLPSPREPPEASLRELAVVQPPLIEITAMMSHEEMSPEEESTTSKTSK